MLFGVVHHRNFFYPCSHLITCLFVGIVYSKDLLDVFSKTLASDDDNMSEENEGATSSDNDNETIHSSSNNLRNVKKNTKENNGKNAKHSRNKSKYIKGGSDIHKSITLDDQSEPISWSQLTAAVIMEDTYFIPETMMVWTALQVFIQILSLLLPVTFWVFHFHH